MKYIKLTPKRVAELEAMAQGKPELPFSEGMKKSLAIHMGQLMACASQNDARKAPIDDHAAALTQMLIMHAQAEALAEALREIAPKDGHLPPPAMVRIIAAQALANWETATASLRSSGGAK